jgi:hypothetical protein
MTLLLGFLFFLFTSLFSFIILLKEILIIIIGLHHSSVLKEEKIIT